MEAISLSLWLYKKGNTKAYKNGTNRQVKHLVITTDIMDELGGFENIKKQIPKLEQAAIIKPVWGPFGRSLEKIDFDVAKMPELCKLLNIPDPSVENAQELLCRKKIIQEYSEKTECAWLKEYYKRLLEQVNEGKLNQETADENIFRILNEIVRLEEDIWIRIFSAKVLNSSKLFEKNYINKICTIIKSYSDNDIKEYLDYMDNQQILEHFHLHSYAQTMSWKGPLRLCINEQNDAIPPLITGNIVNTQTLSVMKPVSLYSASRIVTIENKATYESMAYDSDALYIFIHGFPSRKETKVLKAIHSIAPDIPAYHWGDMDYGGIRIYQFIKGNIFPNLKPMNMDKENYDRAVLDGLGYPITQEKRKKLELINEPDLEELKGCILSKGLEIEQEMLSGSGSRPDTPA